MNDKRECWHLSKARIEKLSYLSDWQLDIILLRMYWIKYRSTFKEVALISLFCILWLIWFGLSWEGIIGGFLIGYYAFMVLNLHKIKSSR